MPKTRKNVMWIDCAKFLAILGVLADHGKGILYEGETIQYISFFSVSVFFSVPKNTKISPPYRRHSWKMRTIYTQNQTFFAMPPFREFSCTGFLSIDLFAFLEYNYFG